MSITAAIVATLLTAGVIVELLCCLALLVMQNAFDRLHYLGPAATVGNVLIAVAVLVQHSSAQACIKGALVAGLLLVINPVLTHATARAARIREEGNLEIHSHEMESSR